MHIQIIKDKSASVKTASLYDKSAGPCQAAGPPLRVHELRIVEHSDELRQVRNELRQVRNDVL